MLGIGVALGYAIRQSLAQKKAGAIEERAARVLQDAKQKAQEIVDASKSEADERRKSLLQTEELLLKREEVLAKRLFEFEAKEEELAKHTKKLEALQKNLEAERGDILAKLEQVSHLSQEEAKEELFKRAQNVFAKDIEARLRKLETEGEERYASRAREIISYAIQKTAVPQAQEITTSTVVLASEDLKGKIIGKEGRNIRSLERLAGVEIIVDETPEAVVISGFDPVRRHVAKVALERLIKDGRIQPARIEEEVAKAQGEIEQQMKEAGEAAAFELGIVGLDPRLIHLLGRLRFRTSYGQNVLLHSIEVAYLAGALAAEVGADVSVAKKAGLFHDIGKALDHQVEGSHVEIGMRILEKFGAEKAVIDAMKSHHEQFPYESVEAILVQTADAISASRPGARKDTLENYLKRIGELEQLAVSFKGVQNAYAIQAGREIRIFVKSEEIDDPTAQQMAKDIAGRIEQDLRYPGEIKVTLIRENRFVEYAR